MGCLVMTKRGSVNPRLQAAELSRLALSVAKPNTISVQGPDSGLIKLGG